MTHQDHRQRLRRESTQTSTVEPLNLWLDDSRLDDSGNGKTLEKAFKTWEALVQEIPDLINHRVHIRIKRHLGTGYPPFVLGVKLLNEQIILEALDYDIIQGPLSAAATSGQFNIDVVGGGLTPDDVATNGLTAHIISGTGAGQKKTIINNDVNGYIVGGPWTPEADDTSVFNIERNAVEQFIEQEETQIFSGVGPRDPVVGGMGLMPAVVYIGMSYRYNQGVGLVSPNLIWGNCTVYEYGQQAESESLTEIEFMYAGCSLRMGYDDFVTAYIPERLGIVTGNKTYAGWGTSIIGSTDTYVFAGAGSRQGDTDIQGLVFIGTLNVSDFTFGLNGGRLFGGALNTVIVNDSFFSTISIPGFANAFVEGLGIRHAVLLNGPSARANITGGVFTSVDGACFSTLNKLAMFVISSSLTSANATGTGFTIDLNITGFVELNGSPANILGTYRLPGGVTTTAAAFTSAPAGQFGLISDVLGGIIRQS